MKEIKVKNFRCVEHKSGGYRVYFTLGNEERFVGYYNGWLSGDEVSDEKRLTNSLCDYTEVIQKWEMSDTRTVYLSE